MTTPKPYSVVPSLRGPARPDIPGLPEWLTELQGSYRDHSAGGGAAAQISSPAARARHLLARRNSSHP